MDIQKFFSSKSLDRHMNKTLYNFHDSHREKLVFPRSTLSWILASVLLIFSLLVTVLFLYPFYDQRILVHEEPMEMRMIFTRSEDDVDRKKHLESSVITLDSHFLINPVNLCTTINPPNSEEYQRNPEVKLLILVQSAADHFEERIAIRNTWGSIAKRILGPLRLGFVLDNDNEFFTTDNAISDLIHEESSEFRDIIQINTLDTTPLVAHRSIFMVKWIATMYPHAEYFLKTEDDTFVNIHKIADFLNNGSYTSENRFIAGHIKSKDSSAKLPQTIADACEEECKKDEDCPGGCCVAIGIFPFISGTVCGKFLAEDNGCMKDQEIIKNLTGYNFYICPCAPGLSCVPQKSLTIPLFNLGKIEYDFHCKAADKKDDDKKDDDKKDDDKKDDDKKDDDKKDDKKDDDKKDDDKKDDDKKDDKKDK